MRNGRIDSAAALILKDGQKELLRRRRTRHVTVRANGWEVSLRDQRPLHRGNLALYGGWSFGDLVEALNSRVFFWPGTTEGPIDYGRRHFARYVVERPVLVRVKTFELLDANDYASAQFCKFNSGSPRCSKGRPSPRGPDTFVAATRFAISPSEVVELVFLGAAVLPASMEFGFSPDGPWVGTP